MDESFRGFAGKANRITAHQFFCVEAMWEAHHEGMSQNHNTAVVHTRVIHPHLTHTAPHPGIPIMRFGLTSIVLGRSNSTALFMESLNKTTRHITSTTTTTLMLATTRFPR